MTLTLSLSPTFQLSRDGEPIPLKNKKAQALLTYLALTAQPQTREHLATLLWGDRFDEQARNSLRQALFALRKAVGDDVVLGDDPLALAEEALSVLGGDPLPGFATGAEGFDDWLEDQRGTRRVAAAAEHARRASETSGAEAVPLWQQALALDPVNEPFQRALMEALAQDGRRSEALASYLRFAERLRAELDVNPNDETAAIARRLCETKEPSPLALQTAPDGQLDRAHMLIGAFRDLGGGDIAGFFATELPSEIAVRARAIGLVPVIPSAPLDEAGLRTEAERQETAFFMTGSARQIGNRIRLSAALFPTKTGIAVWNGSETVREDDAFDVIGQFATEAVQALARQTAQIDSVEALSARLESLRDDPERFRAVCQSFNWYCFFAENTRESMNKIYKVVDRGLALFPGSASLIGQIAVTGFHRGHIGDGENRLDLYREGRTLAERSLAMDPQCMEGLISTIVSATWLGEFDAVDRAHATLTEQESALPAHHGLYAVSLVLRGRFDEARAFLADSIEKERGAPVLFYRYAILGLGYFMEGDHAAALVAAENSLAIGREFFLTHLVRIAALERLGRHRDATRALAEMRDDYRDPSVSEFDWLPITDQDRKDDFLNALREGGLPV